MSTDNKAPRYVVFSSPLLLLLRLKHPPKHPLLWTTLSLRSSLKVRDQFSHPYTTTGTVRNIYRKSVKTQHLVPDFYQTFT